MSKEPTTNEQNFAERDATFEAAITAERGVPKALCKSYAEAARALLVERSISTQLQTIESQAKEIETLKADLAEALEAATENHQAPDAPVAPDIQALEDTIADLRKTISNSEELMTKARQEIHALSLRTDRAQLMHRIQDLEKEVDRMRAELETLQSMKDDRIQKLVDAGRELSKAITDLLTGILDAIPVPTAGVSQILTLENFQTLQGLRQAAVDKQRNAKQILEA